MFDAKAAGDWRLVVLKREEPPLHTNKSIRTGITCTLSVGLE